jgi:glycosyltransferase involved in cell wall biosynthesis
MTAGPLRIAYLTAGAAGMYCGSCLHDNTLAAALLRLGVDVQLIPTYTPIRTDETDVSVDRVFLGGINVYLQQKLGLFRYLPAWLDRVLNNSWLIRRATARAIDLPAEELGALTVSMLQGMHGFQRKEVRRLCRWLAQSARPQLVVLSNLLIGGCIPELQRELQVPVLVTLQGDDVFVESLPEPYKSRVLSELRRLAAAADGFLVHSQYYATFMAEYLGIPPHKLQRVPLGIDLRDFETAGERVEAEQRRPPTIGYLARLAPEKGLHVLVDAFLQLRAWPGTEQARLRIAGWLGPSQRAYAEAQFDRLRAAGLAEAFQYDGELDRPGKIRFLQQLDVFSVPATYRDPKGLYVLEALTAGVPVVQPHHGAFPELLAATGGGRSTPPGDAAALARALHELLTDPAQRRQLGEAGQRAVRERFHAEAMAQATLDVFQQYQRSDTSSRGR